MNGKHPEALPADLKIVLFAATLLLAGCAKPDAKESDALSAAKAAYRKEIFDDCMSRLPAGPQITHYNDWDEVVSTCDNVSYYQMNTRFP